LSRRSSDWPRAVGGEGGGVGEVKPIGALPGGRKKSYKRDADRNRMVGGFYIYRTQQFKFVVVARRMMNVVRVVESCVW
jgi:hypothetical protein